MICGFQGELTMFKSYLHRYPTPHVASKSSSPLWYSVRRASAHIIVLSSYSPFGNLFFHIVFFIHISFLDHIVNTVKYEE